MTVFRVSINSPYTNTSAPVTDRPSRVDDKSHNKEIRVRIPSEISSRYFIIKLPKQPTTFTKIGELNTILVDFPLSQESNRTVEKIRRQIIENDDTNSLLYSNGLTPRPLEKIYHAEEISDPPQENIVEDLKLLYKEIVHWVSPHSKASPQSKKQKRDESHDETKGGGDRERLWGIWYDLVEALQYVALFHVLFYLFLVGLALGVLFITDYE